MTPSPIGVPTPPAVDLIDTTSLYASAPIDEVDAPDIRTGMQATQADVWRIRGELLLIDRPDRSGRPVRSGQVEEAEACFRRALAVARDEAVVEGLHAHAPDVVDPLVDNNPITLQILGICSALAVTTTLAAWSD